MCRIIACCAMFKDSGLVFYLPLLLRQVYREARFLSTMMVKRGTNPETPPRTSAMQKDQAPKWTRGVRLQTEDFKLHLQPTLLETNMETQKKAL